MRGIPAVALEADAHLGVTNRLLRPFVRRICLSFPIAGLEPPKYVLTGRPLAAAPRSSATREQGLRDFGLVRGPAGGAGLRRQPGRAEHQPRLPGRFRRARPGVPGRARLRPAQRCTRCAPSCRAAARRLSATSWSPTLTAWPAAMAAADLIVARSGGSVAEIAALGKPAMLVPYPYATRRPPAQERRVDGRGGAAALVADAELHGRALARARAELLGDPERLGAPWRLASRRARPA